MARPRIFDEERVGVYIRKSTRKRLNSSSKALSEHTGRPISHDKMINYLLDLPDHLVNNIPQMDITVQDAIAQEITIADGVACSSCKCGKCST